MPDWKPSIRERLAELHIAPAREEEIVEELADHLDERYRELVAAGTPRDQAAALAMEELESHQALADRLRRARLTAGLLQSMLFGVGTRDLSTYLAVGLGVALVGLAANYIPAKRAASIEPVKALRAE